MGRGAGVGRGLGVGCPRGVGVGRGVGVALPVAVALAVGVGLGVGVPDSAQYLPPVFKYPVSLSPAHTIIWLSVQTAAGNPLASGTSMVLVPVQPSVSGSYLPPVFK
jgi:hypothetical protein